MIDMNKSDLFSLDTVSHVTRKFEVFVTFVKSSRKGWCSE